MSKELSDMFINNKYYRWYLTIVSTSSEGSYTEQHHIIPKSMGGNNAKSNLVRLSYRKHFLAHWLLIKCTKGENKWKMSAALSRMTSRSGKRIISSWQYAIARKARSERMSQKWQQLTAEERRALVEPAQRAAASQTKEQLLDKGRRAIASQTPEQLRNRCLKGAASMTLEERTARALKSVASQTLQQLKDKARRGIESQTPEQLKERARKGVITRMLRGKVESNTKGGRWVNNGKEQRIIKSGTNIPEGWSYGPLKNQDSTIGDRISIGLKATFAADPTIIERRVEKYKITLAADPTIQARRVTSNKAALIADPTIGQRQGEAHKAVLAADPTILERRIAKYKATCAAKKALKLSAEAPSPEPPTPVPE